MTARGQKHEQKSAQCWLDGVVSILCDKVRNAMLHTGDLCIMQGVFLMLRSGLASRMHTIYKERTISAAEGSENPPTVHLVLNCYGRSGP